MVVKLLPLVTIVNLLLLDSVHSVWSTEMINTNNVTLLNQLEYCIVNDSAIRKKTGDDLLIIINDTGGWLVVTNGSDLFMFPLNGSDCENVAYNPDIVLYAVQTSIHAIVFLVATCIIILHLHFKELQTVFGILTLLFCFFLNVHNLVTFVHNRYQFTHKVDDSGTVCAVLFYMRGILNFFVQFTRLTILFQFAYLMYNAYRVKSDRFDIDNKLILKYVTFITSITMVYSVMTLSYDLMDTRTAFSTENGYCATEFDSNIGISILVVTQLASVSAMQIIVFFIGMMLYFWVNKRCCEFRSTDTRTCLTLGSTSGLDTLLFLGVQLTDSGSDIAFLSSSIGTCIQMPILLIIFLTSKKVKTAIFPHNYST